VFHPLGLFLSRHDELRLDVTGSRLHYDVPNLTGKDMECVAVRNQ